MDWKALGRFSSCCHHQRQALRRVATLAAVGEAHSCRHRLFCPLEFHFSRLDLLLCSMVVESRDREQMIKCILLPQTHTPRLWPYSSGFSQCSHMIWYENEFSNLWQTNSYFCLFIHSVHNQPPMKNSISCGTHDLGMFLGSSLTVSFGFLEIHSA